MRKEIIALLKSSDPKERAKGIRQLAESNDPDSLKILGALYKKETHEGVKKLAAQVAHELKSKPVADEFEQDLMQSNSAPRDPKQAKIYLEQAMDAIINLENDEAWKSAQKAFMANPDYADDDYAVGLAAEITGADRSIAVETLMRSQTNAAPEKAKRTLRKNNDSERVSWGKALVGVGIYSFLAGIIAYLPFIFMGDLIFFLVDLGTATGDFTGIPSGSVSLFANGLGIYGIFVGLSTVVTTAIGLLITYSLVHFSATSILSGKGYFTNLLYNLRTPLIVMLIVSTLISGLMLYVYFSELPSDPAIWQYALETGDNSVFEDFEAILPWVLALNCLNLVISLGFTVWISMIIGKTYDFGGVKGCLSIIISSIIMGIVFCGCYFTILSSMFAGFSRLQ